MSLRILLITKFVSWRTRGLRKTFRGSLEDPDKAQAIVLAEILTLAGKSALPDLPTEFSDYPKNMSWTRESVKFFEFTSGSSGLKKGIPYTASLLQSFENMFLLWVDDILQNVGNKFSRGKIYMSISPKLESMGMVSDDEYLSPPVKILLKPFLAVSPALAKAKSGEIFLKQLCQALLQARDLEVLSLWSPSYFLSLLDWMFEHKGELDPSLHSLLEKKEWKLIWPKLQFISAWQSGHAAESASRLAAFFPQAIFQAKGLLATEAPMTMPLLGVENGAVPLWREVYFEFLNEAHEIRKLSAIRPGQCGSLLVSTKGGLLRYKIGDQIKCTGLYRNSPLITFLGRENSGCDLVGEKLDESQLLVLFKHRIKGPWALLPQLESGRYFYVLLAEDPEDSLEQVLMEFYHYKLARELKQLYPLKICRQKNLSLMQRQFFMDRGMRAGDIKEKFLWNKLDEASAFLKFIDSQRVA